MKSDQTLPPPDQAWEPLPAGDWDRDAARHLLLRASFSAHPERVDEILAAGPARGVELVFGGPRSMPVPDRMVSLEEEARETFEGIRQKDAKERQRLRRAFRRKARTVYNDYAVHWYGQAADPDRSAIEKYVLFLQNIFVVGATKVLALEFASKGIRANVVAPGAINTDMLQKTLRSGGSRDLVVFWGRLGKNPMPWCLKVSTRPSRKPSRTG